jgi:hypothetical protein
MLMLLAAVAIADPRGVARATLRAVAHPSVRHPPQPFDVQVALWADLPGYGAAACAALQRGEAVESDPIGTIAALPAEIHDRLLRDGAARNVARLRDAGCHVTGPAIRSVRRKDAPAWLDDVVALDVVPLACENPGSIVGLAVVTRRGASPTVADVVHAGNADGYAFLGDMLMVRK